MKVNEIFYSIQGEGMRTGEPTTFVRFSGCNLACSFCSTDHQTYGNMEPQEIVKIIEKFRSRWVCLTGGEPFIQNEVELRVLGRLLAKKHYKVQVETNGTVEFERLYGAVALHLTLSPKQERPPSIQAVIAADELKYVVSSEEDLPWIENSVSSLLSLRRNWKADGGWLPIYLQPKRDRKTAIDLCVGPATDICVEAALKFGWRVSLQTQKVMGL